jgi:hypothetical protein
MIADDVSGTSGGMVGVACRGGHVFGEAAIAMHADHLQVSTDVASPRETRVASSAADNRIDGNQFANARTVHSFADGVDAPDEFVADDAWVHHEWVLAVENVHVRAADSSIADAHANFARAGLRFWPLTNRHLVGLLDNDA